jgi:hypothetical protein
MTTCALHVSAYQCAGGSHSERCCVKLSVACRCVCTSLLVTVCCRVCTLGNFLVPRLAVSSSARGLTSIFPLVTLNRNFAPRINTGANLPRNSVLRSESKRVALPPSNPPPQPTAATHSSWRLGIPTVAYALPQYYRRPLFSLRASTPKRSVPLRSLHSFRFLLRRHPAA